MIQNMRLPWLPQELQLDNGDELFRTESRILGAWVGSLIGTGFGIAALYSAACHTHSLESLQSQEQNISILHVVGLPMMTGLVSGAVIGDLIGRRTIQNLQNIERI